VLFRSRPDAVDLLAAERAADVSDAGAQQAIMVEASLPDPAVKAQWVAAVLDADSDMPLSRQRSAMGALFPSNQGALHTAQLAAILGALPEVSATRDHYFTSAYVRSLLGGVCDDEGRDLLTRALRRSGRLQSTALRFLSEAEESARGCVAFRDALASAH